MGGNSLQRCAFSSNGGVCHASPAHRTGITGVRGPVRAPFARFSPVPCAILGAFPRQHRQIEIGKVGSPGRTRTSDPAVNSRLLYQLSYRGSGQRDTRHAVPMR